MSAQNYQPSFCYIAAVGVGSPATTYNLIVDTGSSNTWVGAGTAHLRSGSFSGTEYLDTGHSRSGLVITQQSIGVAATSTGFSGVDGIGIGPDLTEGTLTDYPDTTIPTVTTTCNRRHHF
ncbi:hypothetical protein BDR07DRAFT_1384186 [Suillus spraguei]|nr:hypothetical protein BDR07DRAFT_1384186 [Suillus spraguei]